MKNIAFAIGYTNQSKFAANFKKRYDKLHSEVRFLYVYKCCLILFLQIILFFLVL
jgi:hypothetical protein